MTYISHYGTPRHSGRYPWGSGGHETIASIERMQKEGLTEKEIAAGFDMKTTEFRSQKSLLKQRLKEDKRLQVVKLKDAGMSVAAISREANIPEQTVRDLLKPMANLRFRLVRNAADLLAGLVDKYKYVDIGKGTEIFMKVTRTQMDQAVKLLENDGYEIHYLREEQLGTRDKRTSIKVLAAPGTEWTEVNANKTSIVIPNFKKNDVGELSLQPTDIKNVDSKRVLVKYKNDGGAEKDGLIELRRGVPELNLGNNSYAQVRIGVDGTHFMKGMAVLRDDLPDGVDIVYNTKKDFTGNKLDAMKEQKVGDEAVISQFGSVVVPNTYLKNGKETIGAVNIVGEKKVAAEGAWSEWSNTLASQVLSKQSPRLAKNQLDIIRKNYAAEFDEITKLTDPTVKNHLLMEFAEKADKASVDLKAAALPGQTTNVLLPDPKMKPTEVYAPNYNNGDVISLIRYPHGGTFEIPTLRVNNKKSDYKKIIGTDAKDAIAIHPDVAAKLSGADFDGDFVLAVPNKKGILRTSPSLKSLESFDPITAYPYFEGMRVMPEKSKGRYMGDISNLITDMTIKGAAEEEIARAVKHSMVVIDAPKHELNFRKSEEDHGIAALKTKYQGGPRRGASTLISQAKSQEMVPARKDYFKINTKTGEKEYQYTGETYIDKKGNERPRLTRSKKLAEQSPYDLVSKPGTAIEKVYADHSQGLKDIANAARLESLKSKSTKYNPAAAKQYQKEVESLDSKYKAALKARPVERKAQVLGKEIFRTYKDANPDMSYQDKRTQKARALEVARTRLGAKKPTIDITPQEWMAIELGAISPTRLKDILRNADMDQVRKYATPRAARSGLTAAKQTRAKSLLKAGYTNKEVALALGVPVTLVRDMDRG